ncbi:MAG TPA: hypothetical protein VMR74_02035 [Gammaproteobacteria bacterium]|nr:hypothetical protein [Gammaproteobacteria bacterium]
MLAGGEREEAILQVTRQKRAILQVLNGLALGVQHVLYSLDDVVAIGQKRFQELDMRLEWRLARTFADHNAPPNESSIDGA